MAGSWSGITKTEEGFYGGRALAFWAAESAFTADAGAATIPDLAVAGSTGLLCAAGAVFDGTTPPDSLTLTVKDKYGTTVVTGTLAATGRIAFDDGPQAIVGGCTVSCSGNTTNSAKATVFLIFSSNVQ